MPWSGNTTSTIRYDGYIRRFGLNRRPAVVRYETRHFYGGWNEEERDETTCTLFLDGKRFILPFHISKAVVGTPATIVTVFPTEPGDEEKGDLLEVRRFSNNSFEDWSCLLWETKEFDRMGDKMAFAPLAIALYKFDWENSLLSSVLQEYPEEIRTNLLGIIEYISWSLSASKITKCKELLRSFGRESGVVFPEALADAARILSIVFENTCVHNLADRIAENYRSEPFVRPEGFLRLLEWLQNDEMSLPLELIEHYHIFLRETSRNDVLKRFFFDVKRGAVQFDASGLDRLFTSRDYQYYPLLRYVYENYPLRMSREAEFFVDCLNTYRETNQERFQVTDGILDRVVQKSLERNLPIELKFYQWLCKCEGGIIVNPDFVGFSNFEVQYELDEMRFEEDSLKASIKSILSKCCRQHSHEVVETVLDPETGEPVLEPGTNKQITRSYTVKDPKWSVLTGSDNRPIESYYEQVSLFVNWNASNGLPSGTFTEDMMEMAFVQDRVREYAITHFGDECPWLSLRQSEPVIPMFGSITRMRAIFNENATIGESPGVDEEEVKVRIRNRLSELFGPELECDYDPVILNTAQRDTFYNRLGSSGSCFIRRIRYYRRDNERYCAPKLADIPKVLTGKRCAICQNDMCFLTSIKKNPEWREYKLPHVLEILGYSVLTETEAGVIPNNIYNQFVNQVNKAIRFYRLIVCKGCGHILFPARTGSHSLFKCILPCCEEFNKEVYLNWCHQCKTTVIDSRETKKCPNGLYICPSPRCGSCCSDDFFQMQATKSLNVMGSVPQWISNCIGNGHNNKHIYFCSKCGTQKEYIRDGNEDIYLCPNCDSPQNDEPEGSWPPTDEPPFA